MRAGSAIASGGRHAFGMLLQGILVVAIIAALAFAAATVTGRGPGGANSVFAAKPASGVITVAGPVYHGDTTTATVNPGGNVEVFVQCWNPDYVFAAFYPVDASNQAKIGPLWATTWTSGGGECTAKEGYFRQDGFGKWVTVATTKFTVNP